jgi:hypothetical protein
MNHRRKYGSKFSADTTLTYNKANTLAVMLREKNKHQLCTIHQWKSVLIST